MTRFLWGATLSGIGRHLFSSGKRDRHLGLSPRGGSASPSGARTRARSANERSLLPPWVRCHAASWWVRPPPQIARTSSESARQRSVRLSRVPWNFGGGLVMSGGAHVLIILAVVGESFSSDMPFQGG